VLGPYFKADMRSLGRVWLRCGFCDVALYKTSNCFKDWHSLKGYKTHVEFKRANRYCFGDVIDA
jgi:hypothetical protein